MTDKEIIDKIVLYAESGSKWELQKFLKGLKEKLNEIKDNEKDEHNLSLIESILKEIEDGI